MTRLTLADHPLPWSTHHDEDPWIRDAKGRTVCINLFTIEFCNKIVALANGSSPVTADQRHTALVLNRLRTEAQMARNSGDKPILTRSFELAIAEIERLCALTALQRQNDPAPPFVNIGDREDWRVDFVRYGGPFIVECGRTKANPDVGDTIAHVFASYDANGKTRDFPTLQRRCYLIAAAPAMLAVLQQILRAVDGGQLEMNSPEIGEPGVCEPHPWHEEWLHYARQAVYYAIPKVVERETK